MTHDGADFWTDETSVLFKSFWGWTPETWATVGWSRTVGRTYRNNLFNRVTDPFIVAIYVTRSPDGFDRDLVGKVAGFYLMSHETGHRDEFSHPAHHTRNPGRWEHALRALRAFTYISDPLLVAADVEPDLRTPAARSIASWGRVLTDRDKIRLLLDTAWREVTVYRSDLPLDAHHDIVPIPGVTKAGPMAKQEYLVSPNAAHLERSLYVLRLDGDADAYLGEPAGGGCIVKVGVSVRPESRRRDHQKAMPLGAFRWRVERPRADDAASCRYPFDSAVAGEYAMKKHLLKRGKHLGGEFYLASKKQIEIAWKLGCEAARAHQLETA